MSKLQELTKQEQNRQRDTLNLIASENYPSPKVLELLGSIWMNKYAEGYPGKRYYAGNMYSDEMESYVQSLALQVFAPQGGYDVNVQVLSGSPANSMVYLSFLEQGDTVLALKLANGGHLSHMHQTSNWLKFFNHVTYDLKESGANTFEIDIEDFRKQLEVHKPKLTIIGFSAYSRQYEFSQMCKLAHEMGSLVLADIAHINGLVAAGLHDSPFKAGGEGADFVTMTTHKTLRGPRAALLFSREEYISIINKTIFPGTSGGPHLNKIAAVGQSLEEIIGTDSYPDGVDFTTYSQNVLDTCVALERGINKGGLEVVSPTQNHLSLVRLPDDSDSLEIQKKLEEQGFITNRNMLPFDTKSAWRPSGLRLGTAALASRGLTEEQAELIGESIASYVLGTITDEQLKQRNDDITQQLNWWY
jgi:glycine hydroxymethyltransferase